MPVIGGVLVRDDEAETAASEGGRSKAERARAAAAAAEEDEGEVIDTAGPYEKKLEAARHAVGQDPKRVAQVVKSWLAEDGAN
jgi:flagellar M-ring protein FliF